MQHFSQNSILCKRINVATFTHRIGSIIVLCKHAHMNELLKHQNYAKSKIIHIFNVVTKTLLTGRCINLIAQTFYRGIWTFKLQCTSFTYSVMDYFFHYDIAITHEQASGFTSITVLCTLSCFILFLLIFFFFLFINFFFFFFKFGIY